MSHRYVTSKFRGDEIHKFSAKKQCLWVEILNKSYKFNLEIEKNSVLGFVVIEPEHLPQTYDEKTKEQGQNTKKNHQAASRKSKRQYGGSLNPYEFAYAGRDTVNQAAKVAPGVIKAAPNNINKIAEQRINQIISQGGKELERILPKISCGATEDVYKTPFRLLGNFGKK